jgi:hypothetical protein
MSFDSTNKEGLVGTEQGCIFYVNFETHGRDCAVIRLVTSNNMYKEAISMVKYDEHNPELFFTNTSSRSGDLKLFASNHCDQVMNFPSDKEEDGHVVFVLN